MARAQAQPARTQPQPAATGPKTTQYIYIATSILLAGFIWWVRSDPNPVPTHPVPPMFEGAVVDAPITLVTSDKHDLACMGSVLEDGYHCEFAPENKPFHESKPGVDPNDRKKLLAPYRTIDDILFLIPGMFEEPAVAERYNDEPANKTPRDKQQRFTAQCKLKLTKEVSGVMVRWNPKGQWQGPHKAWIGVPSNCQVSEP